MNPSYVTTGTINSGATAILTDVANGIGSDVAVSVVLTQSYAMQQPPGWPERPFQTGGPAANLSYATPLAEGATISLLQPEADALVAAGGATLA